MRSSDDDLTSTDFASLGLIGVVLALVIAGVSRITPPPSSLAASPADATRQETGYGAAPRVVQPARPDAPPPPPRRPR